MLDAEVHMKLLFLPKIMRFMTGFKIFEVKNVYDFIKKSVHWRIEKIIKENPLLAEDKD
jgi:hypothetical protein